MLRQQLACAHVRKGITLTAIIVALFASGCASPSRVPLSPDKTSKISSSQTVVALSQAEIGTDINRSNITAATGGGLIGAIIDAGVNNYRAKNAESAAVPIRDALVKYDVGQTFTNALRAHVGEISWLSNTTVEAQQLTKDNTITAIVKKSAADAVLVLNTDYRLTPNFESVRVTVTASLHPRAAALNAGAKPSRGIPPVIYFNTLSTTFPVSEEYKSGKSSEEVAKAIAADKENRLTKALDQSLEELASMLVFDLEQQAPANNAMYKAPAGAQTRNAMYAQPAGTFPVKGYVVKEQNGRAWVRLPGGELYSVQ